MKAFDDMITGFGSIANTDPTGARGTDKLESLGYN